MRPNPCVRTRYAATAGVAAALALSTAACSGNSSSSAGGTARTSTTAQTGGSAGQASSSGQTGGSGGLRLGYSTTYISDPFQAVEQKQVVAEAQRRGLSPLQPANANGDVGKQVTDVSTLMNAGATGLVIVSQDSRAIIPALNNATAKKVPVVTVDTAADGGKAAMIVRADNYGMGKSACQAIGKALHGKGKALELQGDLASVNAVDRTAGFEECLKASFPGISLIARPTKWVAQVAADDTQTVLRANPDLGAVYMQSDSVMLSPVLNTLQRVGHAAKVGQAGHIALVSVDGTALADRKVRDGVMDAVVSQPVNLYAKYGVDYLVRAYKGEKFKEGPTNHNSKIVTYKGNLMDLLPAPLVTKNNASDPNLWGNQSAVSAG